MAGHANSMLSIFYALGANLAIFVAKLGAALYTGSGAMLAEAVHSLADSGNQLLLILGLKRSSRPPSPSHPLGYGKAIYFWSFIVALILFSMGGMFSIYEGFHKIHNPEPLQAPLLAIGVLVFSIFAEGLSLLGCIREVNKIRGNRSLFRWFCESRESELLVVFGEDLAALLGLSFALCAVLLTMLTGNPFYDACGSIIIGSLLVIVAIAVGLQVKRLLIGQGVTPELRDEMVAFLEAQEGVEQIYNMLTLQLGKDVMVAVKARMKHFADQREMIEAINRCEQQLKQKYPQVAWSFFEPDVRD